MQWYHITWLSTFFIRVIKYLISPSSLLFISAILILIPRINGCINVHWHQRVAVQSCLAAFLLYCPPWTQKTSPKILYLNVGVFISVNKHNSVLHVDQPGWIRHPALQPTWSAATGINSVILKRHLHNTIECSTHHRFCLQRHFTTFYWVWMWPSSPVRCFQWLSSQSGVVRVVTEYPDFKPSDCHMLQKIFIHQWKYLDLI